MKKVVIAGGTGFVGQNVACHYLSKNYEVLILTRGRSHKTDGVEYLHWDGKTLGEWVNRLENADLLVNLAGKSVDCRYTRREQSGDPEFKS